MLSKCNRRKYNRTSKKKKTPSKNSSGTENGPDVQEKVNLKLTWAKFKSGMDCSPKFFLHKPPAGYAPTGHVQTDGSETTVHNKQKSRFLASSSLLVKHSSMSVTCNINHCRPAALQPLAASFFCFIFRPIDTNAVSSLSHHFAERHMREKMEALRSCAVCFLSIGSVSGLFSFNLPHINHSRQQD